VLVVYLLFCLFYQICYAFSIFKQLMRAIILILILVMLLLQYLYDIVSVFLKFDAILDIRDLFLSLSHNKVLSFCFLFFQ